MNVRLNRREALLAMLAAGGMAQPTTQTWAQVPYPLPGSDPMMRVLFFNTHLLPAIAQGVAGHRGQDEYRTVAIAGQLHRYDLIGLCEVFESHRREEIVRIAQRDTYQAFQAIESPQATGRHLICGGLLLLSRYQLEGDPHFITYQHASRVIDSGWRADGFAAKGAIHARLRVQDDPTMHVDCFLTHLESVSSQARGSQIKELAGFIAAYSSVERPVILMGDLNVVADFPLPTAPADSEYRLLTDALRQGDERLVDLWASMQPGRGGTGDALAAENCERIDYVLLSPPRQHGVTWEPTAIRVEPFLDAKVKQSSLSDHAGVECRLTVRRN